MVVADSRARAEDALERIEVEWEPLPVVVDMVAAAEPDSPLVHPDWGTNVAVGFTHAIGDTDRVFAAAEAVFTETFQVQRYAGMPIEGRGVVRRSPPGTAPRSRTSSSRGW
jgi:CO/xanthine dehydrogenase Mo-binding subunit